MLKRVLDLKKFRETHNIKTQKELAEKLELPLTTINKYELIGTDPEKINLIPLSLLIRISDRYQVKIDDILTYKQVINTKRSLDISNFFAPEVQKSKSLCNPIISFWKTVESDRNLTDNQKKFFRYVAKNELSYICSVYHKPVVGLLSKYNQDSVALVQELLGENFEENKDLNINEDIFDVLMQTKAVYFVFSEQTDVTHFKLKKHILPDINIIDYPDLFFDGSNFEIATSNDYDFSICYLNNPILKKMTFVKFAYKNALDNDADFSDYQSFYCCNIILALTKSKQELAQKKEDEEDDDEEYKEECSIYEFKLYAFELLREINEIGFSAKINEIGFSAGENFDKDEFSEIKEFLYENVNNYYKLQNNDHYWIENYLNSINSVLKQLIEDSKEGSKNSIPDENPIEEICKVFFIPENFSNIIFNDIELDNIVIKSRKLLAKSANLTESTKIPSDCTQLKDLFNYIMQFTCGYNFSYIYKMISRYFLNLLQCFSNRLTEQVKSISDDAFSRYLLLLNDIIFSIRTDENNDMNISPYSMNYGVFTIEHLVHYISYQVLSLYAPKAFELAHEVKFYHKTDPYLSKIKKIITKIKDVEPEEVDKVNKKIFNAISYPKEEITEIKQYFSGITNDSKNTTDFLNEFISVNEKIKNIQRRHETAENNQAELHGGSST